MSKFVKDQELPAQRQERRPTPVEFRLYIYSEFISYVQTMDESAAQPISSCKLQQSVSISTIHWTQAPPPPSNTSGSRSKTPPCRVHPSTCLIEIQRLPILCQFSFVPEGQSPKPIPQPNLAVGVIEDNTVNWSLVFYDNLPNLASIPTSWTPTSTSCDALWIQHNGLEDTVLLVTCQKQRSNEWL